MSQLWTHRFFDRIKITSTCWEWIAGKTTAGYGTFYLNGKKQYAHRVLYELCNNLIPKGLQLDHLCRNRKCVNPDHLEIVTNQENAKRGLTGTNPNSHKYFREKTHCPTGHEYNQKNTYRHPKTNYRSCKVCRREGMKRKLSR